MKKSFKKLFSLLCSILTVCCLFTANVKTVDAATAISVTTNKYVTIQNVGSGKYLNVYGNRNANNTNITVYSKDNTSGQNFQFVAQGKGYALIPQCSTSRALNIYTSNNAKSGNNVCTWSKTGHSTQTWIPEYIEEYKAYILKSANNSNLVLTATGSANSSNVNVQTYKKGNKYQLWTSNALMVITTTISLGSKQTNTNKNDQLVKQITDTNKSAKSLSRRSNFNGYCGAYVYWELRARGIFTGAKNNYEGAGGWNGNQWYKKIGDSRYTKSTGGYKTSRYQGARALDTLSNNGKNNVYNIVVSYQHQYGYSKNNPGAGHVVFIHAIYNGKVYYSESYNSAITGKTITAGNPIVVNYSTFINSYKKNYGDILGAVVFTK